MDICIQFILLIKKAFNHLKKIKKPYLQQLNEVSFSVQSMFMHKIYKHLKDFNN